MVRVRIRVRVVLVSLSGMVMVCSISYYLILQPMCHDVAILKHSCYIIARCCTCNCCSRGKDIMLYEEILCASLVKYFHWLSDSINASTISVLK